MEKLNQKQKEILEKILDNENAFITGFAGSGKSYLIEYIYKTLTEQGKKVALTAMTGCAAILINGKTVHSALGIGLATSLINAFVLPDDPKNKIKDGWIITVRD